jgi:gamma-glutamylcyclotransferase (GGCT)/AIG2-like uncharacterized protein YtfP
MDYFFYGTLMDLDVLASVIGRRVASTRLKPATLAGYRRVYAKGATYPVLVPGDTDDRVVGHLFKDATVAEARRLRSYEGDLYDEVTLEVAVEKDLVAARTFLPRGGTAATTKPWHLALWRRRHKRVYLHGLRISIAATP